MRGLSSTGFSARNRILAAIPQVELELLRSGLTPVQLVNGQVLIEANQPGEHVFFLESGLASILAISGEKSAQVGMVGNEGMIGGFCLLGNDPVPAAAIMQAPGRALRIPLPLLRLRLDQCPALREAWLRHVHKFASEVMQTATHNACSTLDQRCARWLLMAEERVEGDAVAVTHEMLAGLLGVFRSGVTVALSSLHDRGLIRSGRGRIMVVDRAGLAEFAVGALRQGASDRVVKADLAIQQ